MFHEFLIFLIFRRLIFVLLLLTFLSYFFFSERRSCSKFGLTPSIVGYVVVTVGVLPPVGSRVPTGVAALQPTLWLDVVDLLLFQQQTITIKSHWGVELFYCCCCWKSGPSFNLRVRFSICECVYSSASDSH